MNDWSAWAWVAAGIVLPCWALGAYNRLVALRSALVAAWSQIEETVRRRDATLSALLQRLRVPLADEHVALDTCVGVLAQVRASVAAVGRKPFNGGALSVFNAYEIDLHEACEHLRDLIAHAPRAPDAPTLADELSPVLDELERQDEKLHVARQWFDRQAAAHDAALLQYPTRLLQPWFGFRPVGVS